MLERQVDVALALGCQRIWLFTPQQDELAIRAQQMAEEGGAQVRLVQRGRQLLGALRQQDELLVLAEGLLPVDREALALLREGPVILRLPAEDGIQAGFERMDRDYCWAGAMILPGRVAERLDELGEDIDPISALLRAGRIGRVRELSLPEDWIASERWNLRGSASPRLVHEDKQGQAVGWFDRVVVDPIGRWLVERPRAMLASAFSGGVAILGSAIVLRLSYPAVALLMVASAALLIRFWISAKKQADARVFSRVRENRAAQSLPFLPDVVGVAALWTGLQTVFGLQSTSYFVVVTCAAWLLASMGRARLASLFRHREVLWLVAGLAGLTGYWFIGAAVATAAALVGILLNLRNQPAITQA